MRRNYKFTSILTILFLAFSLTLSAQMSDQEVVREVQRLESAGMPHQQILMELSRQGVSVAQVQRILSQVSEVQDAIAADNVTHDRLRDEAVIPVRAPQQAPQGNPENRMFGQYFFSAGTLTFAPNMNMPTPANHILGAGDEIIIDVWGHSELNLRQYIAPDGHITVPGVGRIQLSGFTVQQAEGRIKNHLATIFSDLVSARPETFMAMSLGNVRTIMVHVVGEVVAPGTFTLSSFATVFHALYVSGGPNNIGSLRNIQVLRGGNIVATIDLYEYLMNSGGVGNITLRDGDIVRVNVHGILAQITGEVRRPMWFEILENETVEDLIRFAGGFGGDAFQSTVSLQRRGEFEREAFTLNEREFASFRLQDGDRVSVGSILDRVANMIEITGAVYRPGQYAIGNDIRTVRDLVNVAQGTTGDAYLYRVQLHRLQEDLRPTMKAFNLVQLLSGRIPDIPLQANDRLHIPSIFSIEDDVTVSIGGEVRSPGTFPFALNMHLEDLILRAGGLTSAASTAQIDVFRRVRDPRSTTVPSEISETFTVSLRDGHIIASEVELILQPFDRVVVRRSPGYEEQQIVTIRGEVLFEGQYARIRRDERLSSFVTRAGGVTEFAFLQGARLYRERTEIERRRAQDAAAAAARVVEDLEWIDGLDINRRIVAINLERALRNPGGDADIILQEGDMLYIPINPGTVEIVGGVLFPNVVAYDSRMSLTAYVRQAGGFTPLAMRNRAYVVHLNGQVSTGRWATVTPGSMIVIPERQPRERLTLQGTIGLTTSLATLLVVLLRVL